MMKWIAIKTNRAAGRKNTWMAKKRVSVCAPMMVSSPASSVLIHSPTNGTLSAISKPTFVANSKCKSEHYQEEQYADNPVEFAWRFV